MFRSQSAKRIGTATAGATLFLSVASSLPAQAADGGGVQKAQKAVTDRINARITKLKDLQGRVPAGQTALAGVVADDISGLTGLANKVAAETTLAGVRADAVSMVNDYRVYLLVAPKVHLTNALTAEADSLAKLHGVHDTLAKNPKADTALLADMQTQLDAADALIAGQITALQAIGPGPDASAITGSVHKVRDAARGARGDLGKALADAKKARGELK